MEGNSFEDVQSGIIMGGGRQNVVRANTFSSIDTGINFDARGDGCFNESCYPTCSGGFCGHAAPIWDSINTSIASSNTWLSAFPDIKLLLSGGLGGPHMADGHPGYPMNVNITDNRYDQKAATFKMFLDKGEISDTTMTSRYKAVLRNNSMSSRDDTGGMVFAHPPEKGRWTRVFLTDAAAKGAVCLDGTPGAFYIRTTNANGTAPANAKKWVIFMEGGGWTSSDEASVGRSKTSLGSSKDYGPGSTFNPGYEGGSMFQRPPYDDATVVYNKYCDGGSWTGALSNPPRVVRNTTIYYRGRGLFDGIFDELFSKHDLGAAKEVTFSGCSAGGLTTYVHADAVAATMAARGAPGVKVVAVADAMFSLNHDNLAADGHWPRFMRWVYENMDPSGASVNDDCVTAMAAKYGSPVGNRTEGWRCMFGASIINFLKTPTFVLNSKYDTWQAAQIIGANNVSPPCGGNISSCPPNVTAFWTGYGQEMVRLLDAMPQRHGAYVHNCQSHCQTGNYAPDYDQDTVHDASTGAVSNMGDAVAEWYEAAMAGRPETAKRYIDRCDGLPCEGDICHGVAPGAFR